MSKNDQSSNKPNSTPPGLNLPALAKEFSDQLVGLEKFSNNSHKQFQDLLIIAKNLSDSLTKLNSIIQKSNIALETLCSPTGELSNIKGDFSVITTNLSSAITLLTTVFTDIKEKLSRLTEINNNLSTIVNLEKNKFKIPKQDFDTLVSTVTKIDITLSTLNTTLTTVDSSMTELPNTIAELFTTKTSTFEQKLSIAKKGYTDNLTSINTDIKFFLGLYSVAKKFFFGSIVVLVLMFLLTLYNTYWIYYFSKELHPSVEPIKELPIEATPTFEPIPPPSITPKSDKSNKNR